MSFTVPVGGSSGTELISLAGVLFASASAQCLIVPLPPRKAPCLSLRSILPAGPKRSC